MNRAEKEILWNASIGLQDVDGIKPSSFLMELIKENIEDKISVNEIWNKVVYHYDGLTKKEKNEFKTYEEADKVSIRIFEILMDEKFEFSLTEYFKIHKKLFDGLIPNAGVIRSFNITKDEPILQFNTVVYSDYETIMDKLNYDFKIEESFAYHKCSLDGLIENISNFVTNIWETHPFSEGNTRTTAVFLIKYLQSFGFDLNLKLFEDNSLYFRNALVRANYTNKEFHVKEDLGFLMNFIAGLIGEADIKFCNEDLYLEF